MKKVKKAVAKKYQSGGAIGQQPGSKKTYAGKVSSKPNSKDEALAKIGKKRKQSF